MDRIWIGPGRTGIHMVGQLRLSSLEFGPVGPTNWIVSTVQSDYPFKAYFLHISQKTADCFTDLSVSIGPFLQRLNVVSSENPYKVPDGFDEVLNACEKVINTNRFTGEHDLMRPQDIGYDAVLPRTNVIVRAVNSSKEVAIFEGSFFGRYLFEDRDQAIRAMALWGIENGETTAIRTARLMLEANQKIS